MKEKNTSILEYVLGLYFHVEHGLGIDDVKKYLNNPNVSDRNQVFKAELVNSLLKQPITPQEFEKLTAEELETQEEVNEFLKNEIWKPLYGNEPVKCEN